MIAHAVEGVAAFRDLADHAFGPWTWAVERDGAVIACAGLMDCGARTALAWALVSREAASCLRQCYRAFAALVASSGFLWIEAHVAPGFVASERLVTLAGFRPLGTEIKMPDGRNFNRWVLR